MSLFGVEGSVTQSAETSPSPERSPTPPNAQNPPLVSYTLDSDEDNETEDETEDEDELAPEEELTRPNRFTGKPQTWRGYTAADRQIAASLEDIESSDLAAHLYNAHNLKRRVRRHEEQLREFKSWRTKESWLKKGRELDFTDPFGQTQTELVPSKAWTAWPLPPKAVPVKKPGMEQADSEEDTWYIEAAGAQDTGEAMREEVHALFLRQAKNMWRARDYESTSNDKEAMPKRKLQVKSEAKGARSNGSQSPASDEEMRDVDTIRERTAATSESEADEKSGNPTGKTRGRKLPPPPTKAAFLADDDEARRLLQPSVDSLLAQVDHLALAIHRSRLNHSGRGARGDRSGSEFTSDAESRASSPRLPLGTRSKEQRRKDTQKKPPSAQRSSDSDSASSYDNTGAEGTGEDSSFDEGQRLTRKRVQLQRPRKDSNSSSNNSQNRDISKQYGLMDWSEVLGLASVTGWNPEAVARAAQRCADLFGEGMSFRTFDANAPSVAEPIQYNPLTIPVPEQLVTTANTSTPKRPYFDTGTLRCPHKDCWGSKQDFAIPYRVVEHLKRVHSYDPRTNDSDNEERKVGGVHIDGFLQPITAKQGWLGGGRAKGGPKRNESTKGKDKGKRVKKQKMESEASTPV
jgi:hypothetical protein